MHSASPPTGSLVRHYLEGLVGLIVVSVLGVLVFDFELMPVLAHAVGGAVLLTLSMPFIWWKRRRESQDHVTWEEVPQKPAPWKLQPGELPPSRQRRFPQDVERLPIVRDVRDKSRHEE